MGLVFFLEMPRIALTVVRKGTPLPGYLRGTLPSAAAWGNWWGGVWCIPNVFHRHFRKKSVYICVICVICVLYRQWK